MAGDDQDTSQMTSVPQAMGDEDVPTGSSNVDVPPVRDPQIINQALAQPMGGGLDTQQGIGTPPMGGLAAIAPQTDVPPTAQTAFQAKPNQNQDYLDQIMAIQKEIKNQTNSSQVPWFQLAAAFLNPGRTGSFGEALGGAAGAMGKYQEEQQARKLPLMQAGLKATELGMKLSAQDLMGKLYEPSKDSLGNTTYKFNPEIAQQIAQATGDPRYVAMIPDEMRKQQIQELRGNVFTTQDGTTGLNTQAFQKLYAADPKEAIETVKSIPEMRRFGLLPSTGAEGTPFDALALVAEGPFKAQALNLANEYRQGRIKDEDADKMTNQLLTAMTSHMDRESARAATAGFHGVAQSLAADRLAETKRMNDEKLSDQQKKNEALKSQTTDSADNVLNAIDLIKNHPGRMNGLSSYDPRQLVPGTKEYDFVHQMEGLKSGVFSSAVQNMRGLGSLSNAEGQKVMNLYGSLNPGMSKEAFDHTLSVISDTMNKAKQRANKQYSSGSSSNANVIDFADLPRKGQ